jgi:hypothetical protein
MSRSPSRSAKHSETTNGGADGNGLGGIWTDKAPYAVTLVVAALAWTITHIVDRLLATPIVTYERQIIENSGKKSVYLTLKNITRDRTFRDVHLILTASPGGSITETAVIPIQPAFEGNQAGTTVGRTFDYTFPEMQPGSQLEISATFTGRDQPTLRMSAQGTIAFVRPSWETCIVENELPILAWLVGIGIGALIIITCFFPRRVEAK